MSEQILFKVTVDNITIEVPAGTTILQAARQIGGTVAPPAMCYYSKLKGSGGKCRTCLVEVSKGSEADPRPMPKLIASCRTGVMDGMEVKNMTSPRVEDARNGVVEFLLLNHPLDCPICDQAGECHLQDLGYGHGKEGTRYEFKRRTFDKHDLGPYIQLHMTRCILCYRCVYTADQLTDKRVHGVLSRGDHSEIATHIEKSLDNNFIGNDSTNSAAPWLLPPIRDCIEINGVKKKSYDNYKEYTVGGKGRHLMEIGVPFHYCFGIKKGSTAYDKFLESYGPQ